MATETQMTLQQVNETTPISFIVRAAREEDIPRIEQLIAPFVEQGSVLQRTYQEFDELLPNFFVAVVYDEETMETSDLIGCATLEIYSPKLAEIRSLVVAKKAQGLGVGRQLVNACVERARVHNVLEVMAITSSDGFFQACGFDYTLPGAKRALFLTTRDGHQAEDDC